jgi:methylglutamate dehydrogenase subunit D
VLERASPLAAELCKGGRDGVDGRRDLEIGEARGWSLLQLAAFTPGATELHHAVQRVLGIELPVRIGQAVVSGGRALLKIGPGQFWVLTRDGTESERPLRAAVPAAMGSVLNLTHGRTCIWVRGPRSTEVLASAITVDLDPEVFRRDGFALTGLQHTPVLVYRSGEALYELYVLRSFALWSWEWLTDAALPFGYDVATVD